MKSTLEQAIRLIEEEAEVDAGVARFEQALAEGLSPEDQATAHLHLGRARLMQKRLKEAKAEFNKALKIDPSLGEAHTFLGTIADAAGDLQTALAEQRRGAELAPESFVAQFNLAMGLTNVRAMDEAAEHFEKAIAISETAALPRYCLARILLAKGRTEVAVDQLSLALALRPDFVECAVLLAEIATDNGNFDGAETILLETLEAAPGAASLLEELTRLAQDRKDHPKALSYAQAWAAADPDNPDARKSLAELQAS